MKKIYLWLIFLLIFLNSCSHIKMFDKWDKTDTILASTMTALTVINYRTTSDLSKRMDEGYYEKYNSIMLGRHPSRGRINTHFICSGIGKLLVGGLLKKNRDSWLGIFGRESWFTLNIGISLGLIHRDFEIGLSASF